MPFAPLRVCACTSARAADSSARALARTASAAFPPAPPQAYGARPGVTLPPAAVPAAAPQAYGVRPGVPLQPGGQPAIAPQQSAQPGQPGQLAPPGAPAAAVAVPEPPQREDSGAADAPLVPGQEAQVLPPGTAPATGELPPGTPGAVVPEAPQGTYRQRRLLRQVPVGEQVLRSLQNGAN